MSSPLNVHLAHYDGPLDLLLDLIRKQQIDIWDIPVATITSQYLEYMDRAREMDMDLGAEFVYMAATLIHIKSRMLLPRDPELETDSPEDDPRHELVQRLLEHEKFKNAAEMLQQKRLIEENVWSNPPLRAFADGNEEPLLAVNLFDLVKAFGELVERAKNRPLLDVTSSDINVASMVLYLNGLFLAAEPGEHGSGDSGEAGVRDSLRLPLHPMASLFGCLGRRYAGPDLRGPFRRQLSGDGEAGVKGWDSTCIVVHGA